MAHDSDVFTCIGILPTKLYTKKKNQRTAMFCLNQ